MRRASRRRADEEEEEEEAAAAVSADEGSAEGMEVEEDDGAQQQHSFLSLLYSLIDSQGLASSSVDGDEEEMEYIEAEDGEGEWEDAEEEEEEEEEEEDEEEAEGAGADEEAPLYVPPGNVHKAIRGSDIHETLDVQTGRKSRLNARYGINAALQIRMGTLNGNARGRFTSGERTGILMRYLPNSSAMRVARLPEQIFCGTYSQDGNMFMSACQDACIRLYDTSGDTFKHIRTIEARDVGWSIIDTCYSPDQRYLIYSSWSDAIRLVTLDGERHEALRLREGGHLCPFSIRFSHDSREVIAGTNENCVFIYDCIHDCLRVRVDCHDNDVNAVCFTDESSNIFCTGSDDYLCKVWDRRSLSEENPQPVGTLVGHTSGITFLDAKNDGRYLLSQGKDQSIKLWDIRRMSANPTVPSRNYAQDYRFIDFVQLSRQHRRLANDASVMTYRGHHSVFRTLIRARFSPAHTTAQRYIYSGSADGRTAVYDVLTGECVEMLGKQQYITRDVSWHPFKPIIAASSWDGTIVKYVHTDE